MMLTLRFVKRETTTVLLSMNSVGGVVLGTYQSIYVKSTGAVTFTLVGFEEQAEIPS